MDKGAVCWYGSVVGYVKLTGQHRDVTRRPDGGQEDKRRIATRS